jgi:hypothetical protein
MLEVKPLPCKEIRARHETEVDLCDANTMAIREIRVESQSSDEVMQNSGT